MATLEIHTLAGAPWYVKAHLVAAALSLVIGAAILLRKKGDVVHKSMGRSWVVLMLFTAVISFMIQARERMSLIHVLSVVVLITVPLGVVHIRSGHVKRHVVTMVSAFAGLAIAGAFTLLPYRMLGQLVFGAR
jgi:uncharacterized membrane protein